MLHIGVVRGVPRLLVQRLVEPVLRSAEAGPIAVQSGSLEELLDHMAAVRYTSSCRAATAFRSVAACLQPHRR